MRISARSARLLSPFAAVAALGLVAGLQLVQACASTPGPVLPALRSLERRAPVVLVPGITGSKLREKETGRIVWGSLGSVFLPRDGGYSLARPLERDSPRRGALEAHEPVFGFHALLGLVEVDVYEALIRLLEVNGYSLGDLGDPRPRDSFFIYPYDWRQGKVLAARGLLDRLQALRRARGKERLQVDFICHSDAAQVVRYLLKYGGGSLEEAEAGAAMRPPDIQVGKVILVGSAAGGSLDTLEDVHRGTRYVPLLGRRFQPEVLFTFPAVYETLPADAEDLFFDEEGEPVKADLYAAGTWQRYGWSVFSRDAERRLGRAEARHLFGDARRRHEHLQVSLDRARRLHRLLEQDVARFAGTRYYVLGNSYLPTTARALVTRESGRWRTYFAGDRRLRSDPRLFTLAAAPGDGHATWTSQTWMSPQEKAAMAHAPVSVPRYHRRIILDPGAHGWILRFLLE